MRKDVAFACQQFAVSEPRACKLLGMDRGSYRYEPRAGSQWAAASAVRVTAVRIPATACAPATESLVGSIGKGKAGLRQLGPLSNRSRRFRLR